MTLVLAAKFKPDCSFQDLRGKEYRAQDLKWNLAGKGSGCIPYLWGNSCMLLLDKEHINPLHKL
jgi:hypothetical protein